MALRIDWSHGGRVALFFLAFALGTPSWSETAPSFVLMKELSPWLPGKPEKSRQVLVSNDGTGQAAEIVDRQIVSLTEFVFPKTGYDAFDADALLNLDETYEAPRASGLVVEGHGNKIVVVIRAKGRSKFISAESDRLPQAIIDFRQKIPLTNSGRTGSFLSAGLLPEAASADLRNIPTLPSTTPSLLKDFPELGEALASPFKFVMLAPNKWQGLLTTLKLSSSAAFLKTAAGDIVRLEFYP